MDIGLVGLGKMGGNMREPAAPRRPHRRRLRPQPGRSATSTASRSWSSSCPTPEGGLGDGAGRRPDPSRPSTSSAELLGEGDLVVDGGNSRWTDDQANAEQLGEQGHRLRRLRCLRRRLGPGERLRADGRRRRRATSPRCQPVFDALKPEGEFGSVHAGKVGAGHFAKMVHNGIEYAMMQAYAEGWELLEKVDMVDNVTEVFRSWREGTVIRSWLLDLLVAALDEDDAPRQDPRLRRGLRRGPVDRRGRASTTPSPMHAITAVAVRPLRLPPGRQPRDEGGRRDAQPVRRPRRRPRRQPTAPTTDDVDSPADKSSRLHVAHLSLHDFRSYAEPEVELEPGVTSFVGRNGQGKTNLVEAIDYLARLSSHRVAARRCRWCGCGADQAVVRAAVVRDEPRGGARGARSTPASPTGPGSTGRRCRGPASCSGWCAPCCSPPRTWPWSRATRPSGAGSSTTCWCCAARRGSPASAPTTTGCSSSATRC